MKKKCKVTKAFTLLELAIVLSVIGLIVAGITVGTTIITQSKIRAIASELRQFQTAISGFTIQYNALPGDFATASTYFSTCTSAAGDGGSCNGNGDGYIGIKSQNWWGGTTYNSNENLRAWQHMNLGGFLPVAYTGFGASTTNGTEPGVNSPKSKYEGGIYLFWGDTCYTGNYYSVLQLAGQTGTALTGGLNTTPIGSYPLLTTQDAFDLDTKMDDGKPTSGKLWARSSNSAVNCGNLAVTDSCVNSASNAYYTSNSTSPLCQMHFFYQ
jgi:prepilin-type N-terminal cleavage/methylation domain-containing protein